MTTISGALRAAGFRVNGTPVPGAPGMFTPAGIMIHHFAGSESAANASSEAQRARVSFGHSPIYHLTVGVDGSLHSITDGRANHAGTGGPFGGWIPADQGNRFTIGISGQCDGSHPLARHPAGYTALIAVTAELCQWLGVGSDRVIGHREYTSRKIDPRDDMNVIRRDVAALLSPSPSPSPRRRDPDMSVVQAPQGSWWLLHAGELVSITVATSNNMRAAGIPAFVTDAASWANISAAYPVGG